MSRSADRVARLLVAGVLLGSVAALGVPSHAANAAAAGTGFTVVARGLDNPRGLTFGPKGEL